MGPHIANEPIQPETSIYIKLYPTTANIIPAIEYNPIFLAHWTTAFIALTKPVSNIQKPAAISITKNPWTKKENELKIYATSASTSAFAKDVTNKQDDRNPKIKK